MTASSSTVYILGEIPDLVAWAGGKVAFRIDTGGLDQCARLTMTVEHPPYGQIDFDQQSGEFAYTPDSDDTVPFAVTFSGKAGGEAAMQSVMIKPLRAERGYIISQLTPPGPGATFAIQEKVEINDNQSEDRVISGMRIVFDPHDGKESLYGRYSKNRDDTLSDCPSPEGTLRTLTICADELVIRGELYLPETNVNIFARELKFEDGGDGTACIVTSPKAYLRSEGRSAEPPTDENSVGVPGKDGMPGRKAGDLRVYVERMTVPEEALGAKRFIMRGGAGQAGGKGLDGGEIKVNAVPPGRPGDAGDGGTFTANRDLARFVENTGGKGGEPASKTKAHMGYRPSPIPTKDVFESFRWPGKTWFPIQECRDLADELQSRQLPDALREEFRTRGFPFPDEAALVTISDSPLVLRVRDVDSPWDVGTERLMYELGVEKDSIRVYPARYAYIGQFRTELGTILDSLDQSYITKPLTFKKYGIPDSVRSDMQPEIAGHTVLCVRRKGMEWENFQAGDRTFLLVRDHPDGVIAYYSVHPEPVTLLASKTTGDQPKPDVGGSSNAWLHSHLMQTVMEYVRDAYLSGQRKEVDDLLASYREALALDAPSEAGWRSEFDEARYYSIRLEVANLLHRLHSQLDYFGNPAGWTPLLSLQACLKMYKGELKRALKTLILAKWVEEKREETVQAAEAMGQAIQTLNDETKTAAQQIGDAEGSLSNLHAQIEGVKSQVATLRDSLARQLKQIREEAERKIRDKEKRQEEKAWLDFATETFSGICSVIPVGQPADVATGDDPLAGAGKIADVLGEATASWLDAEAQNVVNEAKQDPNILKKDKAVVLTHVSRNVGPALGKITDALRGLRAPKDEVEEEMASLAAHDPVLAELTEDIEMCNSCKEELARELDGTLQMIAQSYSRVASNCTAVTSLEQQRDRTLAHLDHDAELYIRDMAQRARQTLIKYLYYVVKSYETTLLEPLGNGEDSDGAKVDYRLTAIFERISELLKDEKGIPEELESLARQLKELFENNLTEIERSILRRYLLGKERWANDPEPECRLSMDQTPDVIRQLNSTGEAVINLKEFRLIPPGYERVRVLHIEVLGDEKNKPQFENPRNEGTVRLIVDALNDGTIRSEGRLYAVRHPTQQISGWTYHFSDGQLEQGPTSPISIALLRHLFDDENVQPADVDFSDYQKYDLLAPPPAWTDVRIRFDRSDLASGGKLPELKSVVIRWHYDVVAANDVHRVLDVCTVSPGAARPLIQIDRSDLDDKSDGFGSLYRIYPKGVPVTLTAPIDYDRLVFSHWEVYPSGAIPQGVSLDECELKLTIDYDTQVSCYYTTMEDKERLPADARGVVLLAISAGRSAREVEKMTQDLLAGRLETRPKLAPCMLTEPSLEDGATLGYLPRGASFTVLEGPVLREEQEWLRIDHRGLVGWVCRLPDEEQGG
jgi:hypothetical protein